MTTGEPYCVWCNQIGHAATTECQRAHNANQERQEFTARMMSNLDGEKDAQIERLTTTLAANSARVESLEAALRRIEEKTNGDRPTVNPENAFEHWGKLNAALVIIRGFARAALQQSPPQGGPIQSPTGQSASGLRSSNIGKV